MLIVMCLCDGREYNDSFYMKKYLFSLFGAFVLREKTPNEEIKRGQIQNFIDVLMLTSVVLVVFWLTQLPHN